jgi:hypothetical protein
MSTKDGGPAFPHLRTECQRVNETEMYEGITIRDYFAAHAPEPPSGWLGSSDDPSANLVNVLSRPDNSIYKEIEWRWFWADQMLAAREGGIHE